MSTQENTVEEIQGKLFTVHTLHQDLLKLGLEEGMTVIVHSSFKSLGSWVLGGPVSVILALEQALGQSGTLVMPTHTPDLSDPASWGNPPVSRDWWEEIRRQMPPYDPDLIPCQWMGVIPETFRKQKGVLRSNHPAFSFAAWGARANEIISPHSLENGMGETSPLARIYDQNGWVLLLGVDNENNSSLHLAEHRASYQGKQMVECKSPMLVDGEKRWVSYMNIDYNSADFERLGIDFARETGLVKRGKVAEANALFMPQRELVDYAVNWLEKHRVKR